MPFSAVRGGRCGGQLHDCVLAAVDLVCPFISATLGDAVSADSIRRDYPAEFACAELAHVCGPASYSKLV